MGNTVIGLFRTLTDAQQAIDQLVTNGFSRTDIDLSHKDTEVKKDEDSISRFFKSLFSDSDKADKYSNSAYNNILVTVHARSMSEAEQASDILDNCGAMDLNEEPAKSSSSQSRFDSDYTTGSDFRKTSAGTAFNTGGATGTAFNTGLSDFEAERADRLRSGTVNEESEFTTNTNAANISGPDAVSTNAGDVNYSTNDVSQPVNQEGFVNNLDEGSAFPDSNNENPQTLGSIPVIQEEMEVGKRDIQTGKVRVRSQIIDRPVEENLRLRVEHINVERNPVNRPATEADLANFREGSIEATEHAEVPLVAKETRVVEEVKVKKDIEEVNQTVRGSVRRQDVEVDRSPKEKKSEEDLRDNI